MEITKQLLLQRLDGLQKGQEELIQSLHATNGAIQEVEYWLTQLQKVDEAPAAPQSP